MKTLSHDDVLRVLRSLRRRMTARLFLENLAASALMVGAALVVFAALNRFFLEGAPLPRAILAGAVVAIAALALIGTALGRRSLADTARSIDRAGQTRDRFVSALAFAENAPAPSAMRAMAERECREFIGRSDFRGLAPVRPPAAGAWLIVPAISLLLLQWEFSLKQTAGRAEAARAQAAVAGTVEQIEARRKETERANEQTPADELKALADEMKQSAERLRAETHPDEAKKAALRELSKLEAMAKEMQRQPSPEEELKELAKALSAVPGMKDVLNALAQDNLAAAAKALDEAEKNVSEKQEGAGEEETREALNQAMERISQQRRLSQALQKLFDQAKKQGGQAGLTQQAMQQLREMLQQQARQGGDPRSGGERQKMTLQQLIAALENMKFGDGQNQPPQGSEGQTPGGGPQIAMQAFGQSNPQGQPQFGDAKEPSGRPGSERDFGTTESPFGGRTEPVDKGLDGALKGQLAEGESLSTMLPAAGGASRANRRYKELYEAMAPAAENAVQQENIPLGSRFFIKRYFESIRPAE